MYFMAMKPSMAKNIADTASSTFVMSIIIMQPRKVIAAAMSSATVLSSARFKVSTSFVTLLKRSPNEEESVLERGMEFSFLEMSLLIIWVSLAE